MTAPRVSVVVPHYRDLAGLDRCLSRLTSQTYAEPFEIVVADNNSPEGEAAVAAVVNGRARLVVVKERGAGPARNGGVAAATGEILAFTDSDCVPNTDWLETGLTGLQRADMAGGRVDVWYEDSRRITPAEAFDVLFGFDNRLYCEKKHFSVTATLFCPKAIFEKVGGFLPDVSEDAEWGHRAHAAGYSLAYVDKALVMHPPRRTWPELLTKWKRIEAETYKLHRSYGRSRLSWLVKSLAMPFSAVVHSASVIVDKRLPVHARPLAVYMLFKVRLWRAWNGLRLLYADREG
ncbi:glycosyltransferase [Phenylobacterium sp.]|uniref:glycosyltransferase family 2 protein n=1 Tax=Phenylobacterium sp. TaxID=1871053 RepID=UPI0025E27EAD|nr:glycosyltransferase [Phenylobacterium sp.]